ncbi:MAG: HNH endonuclease [Deltaproteobacteria bacterium]|nr:HNH endonuclease [Deltaproteobacteria bacterium]
MTKHRKYDLLDIIVQSINDSGWNVLYVGDISNHPFVIKIYNNEESYLLRIYIWNLTHGGGTARPKDEYRIQITGADHFEQKEGEKTLILGWWSEVGVFAGFDYTKHTGKLGFSPSMQIREEFLRKALINGFSPCDKGNGEIATAFRPDFFVNYVQSLEQLHSFGVSTKDFKVLAEVSDQPLELNAELIQQVSKQRQTAVIQLSKKLRDTSFKTRVLTAYSNKCAFSGMQLKLVDAAHIVPVNYNDSTDDTANGISLSALYHRAYDKGLVTFNEQYQIIVNTNEMKKLKKIGFDGGMDRFMKDLRPIINVPPAVNDRPNINFIREANKLRGWKI